MHRCLLGFGLLVVTLAAPAAMGQSAAVFVDPARQEALQERVAVTGTLLPASRSRIATQEAGLVLEVGADVGERVEAGQVLARLDDRRIRAAMASARADRAVADAEHQQREAERRLAEIDLDRVQRAYDQNSASEAELDDAKSALDVAIARVDAAAQRIEAVDAQIDLLEIRLADTEIRAPFAGAVVERLCEPGEWIDAGAGIVAVLADATLEAWLEVPEQYAAGVRSADGDIEIRATATGARLAPTRHRIIEEIDQRSRTFRCVVDVQRGDGVVAGMSVRGFVPVGVTAERLTIDRNALLRDGAGFFVWVCRRAGDDGGSHIAAAAPLQILFETEDRIVVESQSLRAGDLVVVEGNERLRPGQPVTPTSRGPAPGPGAAR